MDGEPTRAAGLFFLLQVLGRLGIEEFLERRPHFIEIELPARILDDVAERLGIEEDDPARRALSVTDTTVEEAWDFDAPARWENGIALAGPRRSVRRHGSVIEYDASGRLPLALRADLGADPPEAIDTLVTSWSIALRRWCRRFARIGVANVVSRPGVMLATKTHLDVQLEHDQADVRIRLAGMDIDPGWLPWFGRVVLFHYGEPHG